MSGWTHSRAYVPEPLDVPVARGVKRVLCGVDAGNADDRPFTTALALCRSYDAKLILVHAIAPDGDQTHPAERSDFLRHVRARANAARVDAYIGVDHGDPAQVVAATAAAQHVDLVVLGRPHRFGDGGVSVAERALRGSSCPTLVVPDGIRNWALGFERVLCAIDVSEESSAIVTAALMLAAPLGAAVTLLHVEDTSIPHDKSSDTDATVVALRRLQALIPPLCNAPVLGLVSTGDPVGQVLRRARTFGADLMVCGVSARRAPCESGMIRTLLRRAASPVLTVPLYRD